MFKRVIGFVGAALLLAIAQPALASTSTYNFGGVYGPMSTSFSGYVTVPDAAAGSGGVYPTAASASVSYDGTTLSLAGTGTVVISNTASVKDEYRLNFSGPGTLTPGGAIGLVEFTLYLIATADTVASKAYVLPDVFAALGKSISKILQISVGGEDYEASLSYFAAVPLPAGLPLIGGGLVVLGLLARRKKIAATA